MTDAEKKSNEPPKPQVLKVQSDETEPAATTQKAANTKPRRRLTYRPSHKATFIGSVVVIGILALNVGVIAFVLRGQTEAEVKKAKDSVTINTDVLDQLGVSRNPVDTTGTELVVGPDAQFKGKVTLSDDVSIAGKLTLNSELSAAQASFAQLKAGKVNLQQFNVNGDGTISNLNLRKDLAVAGVARFQGAVTMSRLLTVNNNLNVAGNLAVGGTLSARQFHASSLTSDASLTIGGHVMTRGSAPGVSRGSALGSNGSVSISGNDISGTVAANAGAGASAGTMAYVSFRNNYSSTPHVVVTSVGRGVTVYVNRSASGFSIGTSSSLSPGGYAFDYIVMQ